MQKKSLPTNSWRVGSMDHPVWWDDEMVAAYHMEYSHAVRSLWLHNYAMFEIGEIPYFKIVTCIIELM
jgi:hypothetical protein